MKNYDHFYVVARVFLKFFNTNLPIAEEGIEDYTLSRKINPDVPYFPFRLEVGKHVNHRIELQSYER